jgi:predicted alpha/beta-fold hydrolase
MPHATFHVPGLFRSRHVQTLCAAAPFFVRSKRPGPHDKQLRFRIDNGALHAVAQEASTPCPKGLVLLVHGIGGTTQSQYVMRAARHLLAQGFDVVRLNLRGAGSSMPDAPTLYHAGLTSDLDAVVRQVQPRAGKLHIGGFSGGGSLALKMAAEWGSNVPGHVGALVAVSSPLDFEAIGRWIDSPPCVPYRFHVMRGLVRMARAFARTHPGKTAFDVRRLSRLGRVYDYDREVIVPMHGFASVESYWRAASPGPLLPAVRTPALLLQAKDDPMVPWSTYAPWLKAASTCIEVRTSAHGGHLGWVAGMREHDWVASWPVQQMAAFFATHED